MKITYVKFHKCDTQSSELWANKSFRRIQNIEVLPPTPELAKQLHFQNA